MMMDWLVNDKIYVKRMQSDEPGTAQLERDHTLLHPFLPDL